MLPSIGSVVVSTSTTVPVALLLACAKVCAAAHVPDPPIVSASMISLFLPVNTINWFAAGLLNSVFLSSSKLSKLSTTPSTYALVAADESALGASKLVI